ncbi:atrophin-1 [Drosophila nasuta]|uniref:atrophin-1 n=1 Tax=Drosophila nasuta TaxID=42062 RepID=UPI00295E7382|nr:atrophin-1 [Drosophila nasuta]
MFNNPQHFKLLLLLLCPLAFGQGQHLEPLHRNKRTLTTICVEIQPSGPQNEPYFMCKGADFANDPVPAAVPAAAAPPVPQPAPQAYQQSVPQSASQTYQQPAPHQSPASAAQLSDQPIYNYGQPLTPFPSFPSFGAGFFQHPQSYESAPATPPSPPPSPPAPPAESPGAVAYGAGPAAAVAFPPAPAAPSYGLPAVPYPAAGGPAAAARGAAPVAGPAATPTAYAAPGAKKSPPAAQHKSSASIGDSRHRVELDDSVLGMPNVGFKQEELHSQYRQPVGTLEPPMAFMPLGQPAAVPHPHYDDPIMRTFYASLGHEEPQLGQAAIPNEPLVAQVAPANAPYQEAPKYPTSSVAPADGNACNSCNRPCSTPAADNCPSYQHVIIAMPCYGQQQPTHYLAVPGQPQASAAPSLAREPIVGSSFGSAWPQLTPPFGAAFHNIGPQMGPAFNMPSPQVGAAFGMPNPQLSAHGFAMQAPQGGSHGFAMPAPQVGAAFGMPSPQVGAPFGMAPVLNPFGPFGSLNPFNPFNRILGAAAPTTPQPRLHLFGAPEEGTTVATSTTTGPQPSQSTAKYSSNPTASPTKMSTESADVSVGASREAEHEQKEADEDDDETTDDAAQHATESPSADDTTHDDADDAEQNKSVEAKPPTVNELVTKGEDKLKVDKRKRHNSRSRSYTRKLPKLT